MAQFYILKDASKHVEAHCADQLHDSQSKERDELNLNDQRVADTRHFRAGHPNKSTNRSFGNIIFNVQLHTVKKNDVFFQLGSF